MPFHCPIHRNSGLYSTSKSERYLRAGNADKALLSRLIQ